MRIGEWTGANGKRLCPAKKETLTTAGWETKKGWDEIDFCRQKEDLAASAHSR